MPYIDVPPEEAAIIVELIDHNQAIAAELPQLFRSVAAAFAELGMPVELPDAREAPFVVRRGLEELRKKYAGIATPGPGLTSSERTLLRFCRDEPLLETFNPIERQMLEELEERGLVRQLKDGHNTITWELTSAGEREL